MTPKAVLAIVLMLPSLFFVWLAVRGMYRYYRDNRPNRYRKGRRVVPVEDSRSSITQFHRIMRN